MHARTSTSSHTMPYRKRAVVRPITSRKAGRCRSIQRRRAPTTALRGFDRIRSQKRAAALQRDPQPWVGEIECVRGEQGRQFLWVMRCAWLRRDPRQLPKRWRRPRQLRGSSYPLRRRRPYFRPRTRTRHRTRRRSAPLLHDRVLRSVVQPPGCATSLHFLPIPPAAGAAGSACGLAGLSRRER